MQNGKVVDSQGFTFDPEDDDTAIAPPVRAAPWAPVASSGVGAMNEKFVRLPVFERTTEAALGCDEVATEDNKSRRRCEKSATASYVGMIRNP
jgi:hypothetical protein